MSKYHKKLLGELERKRGNEDPRFSPASYLGTPHRYLWISTKDRRQVAKDFFKGNREIKVAELSRLIGGLYAGVSYDEKLLAGDILKLYKDKRAKIAFRGMNSWLGHLKGWAEIDSLCQNIIESGEMLADWVKWRGLIEGFCGSRDISKRRASLVLLTSVVRKNSDKRLSKLAFKVVDKLKYERETLVTKAVSWLLRDMTYLHRGQVSSYLKKNSEILPKIVLRETRRKLETGKK